MKYLFLIEPRNCYVVNLGMSIITFDRNIYSGILSQSSILNTPYITGFLAGDQTVWMNGTDNVMNLDFASFEIMYDRSFTDKLQYIVVEV